MRTLGSHPRPSKRRPPFSRAAFPEGAFADATFAAYADFLAERIHIAPPSWCFEYTRVSPEPWFAVEGKRSRLFALRDTPPAFKRRNLFTIDPDLPVRLRRGRPAVSAETKRANNAARQRRFQQKQRALLAELRQQSRP